MVLINHHHGIYYPSQESKLGALNGEKQEREKLGSFHFTDYNFSVEILKRKHLMVETLYE